MLKHPQKIITSETPLTKFWRIWPPTVTKGAGEDERIMKEDQVCSAREPEAEVITLPRERLGKRWAEAKWNDQKKKEKRWGECSKGMEVSNWSV